MSKVSTFQPPGGSGKCSYNGTLKAGSILAG